MTENEFLVGLPVDEAIQVNEGAEAQKKPSIRAALRCFLCGQLWPSRMMLQGHLIDAHHMSLRDSGEASKGAAFVRVDANGVEQAENYPSDPAKGELDRTMRETNVGLELGRLMLEFGPVSMLRALGIASDVHSGRTKATGLEAAQ